MFLHVLRVLRYTLLGLAQPKVAPFDECTTKIFVGLRKCDGFMHVNNARYLEMLEFARYNQGSRSTWNSRFVSARIWPVIGAIHIQYANQILPYRFVNVTTRIASYDAKTLTLHQDIRSMRGKLHATAVLRISLVHNNKAITVAEAFDRMGFEKGPDGGVAPDLVAAAKQHNERFPMIQRMIAADNEWRQAVRAEEAAGREARKAAHGGKGSSHN